MHILQILEKQKTNDKKKQDIISLIYLGHEEHLHQVPVRHEELRDQVDVVVARRVAKLRRRGLSWPELVVEVGEVERRALSSVVVVAVHVQDLARDS